MPSWEVWVEIPSSRTKRGGGAQALKVGSAELLNESRECFERANICNQTKYLQDKIIISFALVYSGKEKKTGHSNLSQQVKGSKPP
jgi:hypothetical protein